MFSSLREDIASIRQRDPAARSIVEILTCYPGLHAIALHRLASPCWRGGFRWLARFIAHLGRIFTGIEIHPGATIGQRVFIDHGFGVVIGETAIVGDDCTIYQGVTLGGTSLIKRAKRHPTLERGVVVGAGAKVLGGFTVGEYAKIGSNAVVTKEVPTHATAVGNPARLIIKDDAVHNAFTACAITAPSDDPVNRVLHELIEKLAAQEKRIETLVQRLDKQGLDVPTNGLSHLDREELNQMIDWQI